MLPARYAPPRAAAAVMRPPPPTALAAPENQRFAPMTPAAPMPATEETSADGAPAPSCGAPETSPVAMPGPKIDNPISDSAPSTNASASVMVGVPEKPVVNSLNRRGADTDDHGEHENLDAGGDNAAEDLFGEERGLVEQRERDQHEARERGQFELDQRDEYLDRENEEGDEHDRPGDHQHHDLHKILEERDVAHQVAVALRMGMPASMPISDAAGLEQCVGRERRSARLQAEAAEGLKTIPGEPVEVTDDEGEEADIEASS